MRGMLLSLEMNKVLLSAEEDASKRTMNWMPVMGKLVEGKLIDEEQVGALVEGNSVGELVEGNSEKGLELGDSVGSLVGEYVNPSWLRIMGKNIS